MGFLRRLFGGGGGEVPSEKNVMHLYIKCKRCGTPVHVRVNLNNDLQADYGDTAAEGYRLNKDVMDDRCFQLMHLEIDFDSRRKETGRTLNGGTFTTQEEWEQWEAERKEKRMNAAASGPASKDESSN
ncbi:MAG: hypothetical protein AVDCRST_MAG93-4948 [uncultured Chloroflexia bacterium]|uniref:Uncharacterized protein n=1 Tax=uncultured Chloroflexia bacterium TaxID=1672391 RepID=A0A6J4KJ56_9CHLR|nr:MAG: hypothetical protein AVDCRST_MAG93-4948 [uncultured Chloroflexia bacterium]